MGVADETAFVNIRFWSGLLYCTLPFNLMLCGLNDVADWDVDHVNPKRNSAWRRCIEKNQLDSLAFWSLVVQVPFLFWLLANADKGAGHAVVWTLSACVQVSLYNGFFGLPQTSRISFADLPMNIWAWLLPVHLAWLLNDSVEVSPKSITISALEVPPHRSVVFISFLEGSLADVRILGPAAHKWASLRGNSRHQK